MYRSIWLAAVAMVAVSCSSSGPSYVPCPGGDADCPPDMYCLNKRCSPADACQQDGDCSGGLICLNGYCRWPLCSSDTDCPGTDHCSNGRCTTGQCRTDDDCPAHQHCADYECVDDECIVDADCQPDEYCNEGTCEQRQQTSCSTDEDCRADELCLGGTCTVMPSCSNDEDCPSGTICEGGTCARGCYTDSDCPSGGLPQVCRDGHCRQRCYNDMTCMGNLICVDGACVDPECSSDADCQGEFVRCDAGRCTPYTPCEQDGDCTEPDTFCSQGVCEPLPGCAIDQDCAGRPPCDATVCLCEEGTCRPTASCTSAAECPEGRDCVGGLCVPFVCRGQSDCPQGQLCVGGECQPPGDIDLVYDVIILTPGGPVRPGQTIQMEAIAVGINGDVIPGIPFQWASSAPDSVSVDSSGLATAGSVAGDAYITAAAEGTNPPVRSDPVLFTNVGEPQQDTVRVAVIDSAGGNPVAGAQVTMISGTTRETATTDAAGVAEFAAPAQGFDIHVFAQGFDYLSLIGLTARDIRVPLEIATNSDKAGGFTGQMTFPGTGEVSLGLAGTSIGGDLVDLNFAGLLGEIFVVSIDIPGYGTTDVTMPAKMVLGFEYMGFNVPLKTTYYVEERRRGIRNAWAFGGKLSGAYLQDLITGGSSPADILSRLLAYFGVLEHGLQPQVDIFPIPRVQDTDDIDRDGNTSEMRPDWDSLAQLNLRPDKPQTMTLGVTVPRLPQRAGVQLRVCAILAGSQQRQGFTPLGITSATADADGAVEPLTMKLAPAYGGLEMGRYLVFVLAMPNGTATSLPADVALVMFDAEEMPTDVEFPAPFIGFAEDAAWSPPDRTMTSSGVTGANLYRATFSSAEGGWKVLAGDSGSGVSFTLPEPPAGMPDPAANAVMTLDAASLEPGIDLDALAALGSERGIEDLNLAVDAWSRHELASP